MSTGHRARPADDLGPDAPRLLRPSSSFSAAGRRRPGLWGLLAVVNPVLVIAFQGRRCCGPQAAVAAALSHLAIRRGAREASLRSARVGTEGPTEKGHSHGGA